MSAFHKDGQKVRTPEKAVFTNMVMIEDDKGNVLVQNRTKGWNGLVFPGGHLESKEMAVDSAIREIYEETGLSISNLKLCGIKQWFHPDEGRNVCFMFKTSNYSGVLKSSEEGDIYWMSLEELKHSNKVASGFQNMLEVFINDTLNEMYYPDDGDSEAILK